MKFLGSSLVLTLGILAPAAAIAQTPDFLPTLSIDQQAPAAAPSEADLSSREITAAIVFSPSTVIIPEAAFTESADYDFNADTVFNVNFVAVENTESELNSQTETEETEEAEAPKPTPAEIARQKKLIEADQLYSAGEVAAAEALYREAKAPFESETDTEAQQRPEAIYNSEQLPPGGVVYWQQYQTGLAENLESKTLAPLELLVEQHPEFIPAHLHYAEVLQEYEREQQAELVLNEAIALYPGEPKLLQAKLAADEEAKNWLEASLAARQFALFNPEHPQAEEFTQLADQYLENYRSALRSELTWSAVGNVITGALGYALTGNLFGPFSAIETTTLLLQGESGVGDRFADRLQEQLPLVEDEEVLQYVRGIGQELASVAGRDEFEYEFYVILDDRLNAFALPGGKVFVNTGAIQKADSEAELAGLLAHEISHAVLSHGFQLVTQGNLTANIAQFIPYGGTAANLLVLDYSRDMEREADALGTRMLAASDYAADGLYNLMLTLAEENEPTPFVWLSTHPNAGQRVDYLEDFILTNSYNRYAYEGVSSHAEIQERVEQLWQEYQETEEYQQRQERRRKPL